MQLMMKSLQLFPHPLAQLMREYAGTQKYIGTYLQKMMGFKDKPFRVNYSACNVSCLTQNNTVTVKYKGDISIKDVEVGDLILTRFGWKEVLFTKVDQDEALLIRAEYKLETPEGHLITKQVYIEGNGSHPVLSNGEWVNLDQLKVNTVITGEYNNYKVVSITPTGRKAVYDIAVDTVNEYIANGLITHNTGRLSSGGSRNNDYYMNYNIQNVPKIEERFPLMKDRELGHMLKQSPHYCVSGHTKFKTPKVLKNFQP